MSEKEYNELDLQQAWKKMSEEKFSNNKLNKQEIMTAIHQESKSKIANLKKGLRYKIGCAIGFIFFFILLTFLNSGDLPDMIFTATLSIAYLICAYFMRKTYKKITAEPENQGNVLDELKRNLSAVKATLKVEKIWGIFTFLFIIAYTIGSRILKKPMDSPTTLAVIVIGFILFCALLYALADKMNDKRFGSLIQKLETDIIRLETLK